MKPHQPDPRYRAMYDAGRKMGRERAEKINRQVFGALLPDSGSFTQPPLRARFADLEAAGCSDVIIAHVLAALRSGMFESREEALVSCCLALSRARDDALKQLVRLSYLQPPSPVTIDG